MSHEFSHLSVTELAGLVRRREVSPVELVTKSLQAIDESQAGLNAFITVCHEHALSKARLAEAAVCRGDELGPLHGVPFSVKDMLPTKGIRTTYGAVPYTDNVPSVDCSAVQRINDAGAILVGKTATPEFASGHITESPLFGRTQNAWDPTRTSGGSSGGAAVSVAAGLVPLALANDGGGSTRIPAACNAVLGWKQTIGLIPDELTPDSFGSLVYINPVVRNANDLPDLMGIMAGAHPQDAWSTMARADVPSYLEGDLKNVRIAWMPRLGSEVVDPEVLSLCEAAVGRLAGIGAIVSDLKVDAVPSFEAWSTIQNSYRANRYGDKIATRKHDLSPRIQRMFDGCANASALDLMKAMATRATVFRQVQDWFSDFDFLVTPTLTRTALPIGCENDEDIEVAGAKRGHGQAAWFPALGTFNLSGHPALSIPCGWASDGLPVAIQVVGLWGRDLHLMRLAKLYQQIHPESIRLPGSQAVARTDR